MPLNTDGTLRGASYIHHKTIVKWRKGFLKYLKSSVEYPYQYSGVKNVDTDIPPDIYSINCQKFLDTLWNPYDENYSWGLIALL